MDGKRLRVTSGTATYGQPNSTYLAEITDFSLVKAIGTAGNGPAWFEVKLKNGLIYEYGNSADSRATLSGGDTPYAWALSKIRDRQGNNLTIGYAQSSGTLAPMTIDYAQIPSIGATYPYTVTFTYATRDLNDRTAGYIAGTQFSVDSQITAIDVKHGGVNGTEEALYADLIHAA